MLATAAARSLRHTRPITRPVTSSPSASVQPVTAHCSRRHRAIAGDVATAAGAVESLSPGGGAPPIAPGGAAIAFVAAALAGVAGEPGNTCTVAISAWRLE
jgi:hypothetical protein